MTIPFEELAKEWLKDPAVKAEYDRLRGQTVAADKVSRASA